MIEGHGGRRSNSGLVLVLELGAITRAVNATGVATAVNSVADSLFNTYSTVSLLPRIII